MTYTVTLSQFWRIIVHYSVRKELFPRLNGTVSLGKISILFANQVDLRCIGTLLRFPPLMQIRPAFVTSYLRPLMNKSLPIGDLLSKREFAPAGANSLFRVDPY